MNQVLKSRLFYGLIAAALLVLAFFVVRMVLAGGPPSKSNVDVIWAWGEPAAGTTELTRTANGVSATFTAEGFTPGNAVTGWWIIFNHPENCEPEPFDCGPDDMFHPDYEPGQGPAEPDFLLLSGHVIGADGKGTFAGSLRRGENTASGLAEIVCPDTMDCSVGLTNPEGALIILAAHDHGPAQTGPTLTAQIGSYLGGCEGAFNGDDAGFALGPEDIPDAAGECSTIQVAAHMPE